MKRGGMVWMGILGLLFAASLPAKASDNWMSATGYTDEENKWAEETRAYDKNESTYARDTSNRTGWGPFLQLNYSTPIYSDRLRIMNDAGWGITDKVDIDVKYSGSSEWTDVYEGAVTDVTFTTITFSVGNVSAVRMRNHFLKAGYYWWLYELQLYKVVSSTDPQGETTDATSVNATSAILHGHLTEDGGMPCQVRFQYGLDTNYGTDSAWSGEWTDGAAMSLPLTSLANNTTYHFRAQFRNAENGAIISGADKTFTTSSSAETWVSPTAVSDPDGKWTNLINAIDDEPLTLAQSYHPLYEPVWGSYLHLTVPSMTANGFRIRALSDSYIDAVDVDVYKDGAWTDAYQGWFRPETFEELAFEPGTVTEARVRFRMNTTEVGQLWKFHEFDFHQGALLEAVTPASSAVSPAWVEGTVWHPTDTVTVLVNGTASGDAMRFNRRGWCVNSIGGANRGVPLSSTAATSVEIRSMNGSVQRSNLIQNITWTPTDLTGKTSSANVLAIRNGDSLLFTATGTGTTMTIDANGDGVVDYTGVPGDKFAYTYSTAGSFVVTAKIGGTTVGTMTIQAVDASLPATMGCVMNVTRRKDVVVTPVAAAGKISFVPYDTSRVTWESTTTISTGTRVHFYPVTTDTGRMVMRLNGATGPILSDAELQVSTLTHSTSSHLPILKTYSDGDMLMGGALKLAPTRNDIKMLFKAFSGGTVFEETGTNELWINSADLDMNGQISYYILRSATGKFCYGASLVTDN